mgnify:CR=1 FL=1
MINFTSRLTRFDWLLWGGVGTGVGKSRWEDSCLVDVQIVQWCGRESTMTTVDFSMKAIERAQVALGTLVASAAESGTRPWQPEFR